MKISINRLICVLFLTAFTFTSCTGSGNKSLKADFIFEPVAGEANKYLFKARTEGEYQLLEWDFPGLKIKNEKEAVHYFPKKGDFPVKMTIWMDGKSSACTKIVSVPADDPGYTGPELLWSDEFDGNALNEKNWTVETDLRVNNELQNYMNGNYKVSDGYLTITATKVNDKKQYGSYDSARLITAGKREFKYGRMEIRAKLPKGTGIWPAIWMLGADVSSVGWPTSGEIDIMEYVGYQPHKVHSSIHNKERYEANSITSSKTIQNEDEFHVYGLYRTEDQVEFYVDDRNDPLLTYKAPAIKTQSNWPYDNLFFFILNVAVGGDWGGVQGVDNSIFPASMVVDYVRVYDIDR